MSRLLLTVTVVSAAVLYCLYLPPARAADAAQPSACITCHEQVTPGIVAQFKLGKMAQAGLDCSTCHGAEHMLGKEDAAKAELPRPETCQPCHQDQYDQYLAGKHSKAWVAMQAMPLLSHQPPMVGGPDMEGCSGCHKIGVIPRDTASEDIHYGTGACDSCHTRHTFSKAEAQDPRACQTCHMGFDHPQWEMWSTSKHGTIWQIEGDSGRAPKCQTCHMPDGSHRVKTAWGFLALRLPEPDAEWMADRATILQGLGVLDSQGQPTERLAVIKAGDVARLSAEEFDAERRQMLDICSRCHARSFAEARLDASDRLVREADKIMAASIRTIQSLYDKGILAKPAGWTYAPDMLQFYEAPTPLEQQLWTMFLEYRARVFQGAFHINPDYMHWYGWAEMKRTQGEITEAAYSYTAPQGTPTAQMVAAPGMDYEIVELPAMRLVGMAVDCKNYDTSGVPALWERFVPRIGEVPAARGVWGVSLPAADGFRYLAGLAVGAEAGLPAGFEAVTVPAGKYIKVRFDGAPDKMSQEFTRIFAELLPKLGYNPQAGLLSLEEYLAEGPDPQTGAMAANLYVQLN